MFSIRPSSSFIRSCAVRGGGRERSSRLGPRLGPTRPRDTRHLTRSVCQTFFFELLNEERQPAVSHLPAQQLLEIGFSRVPRPLGRHLAVRVFVEGSRFTAASRAALCGAASLIAHLAARRPIKVLTRASASVMRFRLPRGGRIHFGDSF